MTGFMTTGYAYRSKSHGTKWQSIFTMTPTSLKIAGRFLTPVTNWSTPLVPPLGMAFPNE